MKEALLRHSVGVAIVSSCLLIGCSMFRSDFESRFPGFVEQNEMVLKRASHWRPGAYRQTVVETALRNLRWAQRYKRLGFDPELGEEFASEQSSPVLGR